MDISNLQIQLIKALSTVKDVQDVSKSTGISVSTLYRYKNSPDKIPLGKAIKLGEHLGFPIADQVVWTRSEFLKTEKRRLGLESQIDKGWRKVVTPAFTVLMQLPEVTKAIMEFELGEPWVTHHEEYLELRQKRQRVYLEGAYDSWELINGVSYLDFWLTKGRYRGISKVLRDRQIEKLIESLELDHISRRVYLEVTPELPILSCYSTGQSILRARNFKVEFQGSSVRRELVNIFEDFYRSAALRTKFEVKNFLVNPITILSNHGLGSNQ
jgi:predicted DNA-binding transcriptional regulator AlpA